MIKMKIKMKYQKKIIIILNIIKDSSFLLKLVIKIIYKIFKTNLIIIKIVQLKKVKINLLKNNKILNNHQKKKILLHKKIQNNF